MKQYLLHISLAGMLLASCGSEQQASKGGGAIVLGDSSTIVTETDSQYLKDDIADYEPNRPLPASSGKGDAAPKTAPAETPQEPAPATGKTNVASGYDINFGNIKIVFEGIQANDAAKQNPEKQEGLSYVVKSGNLARAKVYVYGAKDVAIRQRYQSRLALNSKLGSVDLRDMGLYTSGWKNLNDSRSGAAFVSTLSDLGKPSFSDVNNAKIKKAMDRELRKRRTNSRTIQSWMKEISKTRDAGDAPCDIILDNLQLQVSGTGTDGKAFRKNIRMSV